MGRPSYQGSFPNSGNLHTHQFPHQPLGSSNQEKQEERATGAATWNLIPCSMPGGLSFGLRSHILSLPPSPVKLACGSLCVGQAGS